MRLGRVRLASALGQADYSQAIVDGQKAVMQFDALLSRLAMVKDDDTRGEILKWIGRSDVPGDPAERYKVVVDKLVSGAEPDDVFAKRVDDLKGVVSEFDAKVKDAESYGTLPAPKSMGADEVPNQGTRMGMCLAGGIALLGLVVVPLLLD